MIFLQNIFDSVGSLESMERLYRLVNFEGYYAFFDRLLVNAKNSSLVALNAPKIYAGIDLPGDAKRCHYLN